MSEDAWYNSIPSKEDLTQRPVLTEGKTFKIAPFTFGTNPCKEIKKMSTVKGKIESMRRDRKGIKVDGEWYSSFREINSVEWKDEVEFEYEQKGRYRNIQGAVRKLGSGGGGSYSGNDNRSGGRSNSFSSVGVELGHAANLAMRMMEQRLAEGPAEDIFTDGIGSADYYKTFMEDTQNIFKVMKGLRAKVEAGDTPAPAPAPAQVSTPTMDVSNDDVF